MTNLALDTPRLDPHLPYLADGPLSATMGLALILAAAPLTELAGWSLPPLFLLSLGVFLLPWSVYNFMIGRMVRPPAALVWINMGVDLSWAVGSVLLAALYWGELSAIGIALVLGQALAVAGMFTAKLLGARALLG